MVSNVAWNRIVFLTASFSNIKLYKVPYKILMLEVTASTSKLLLVMSKHTRIKKNHCPTAVENRRNSKMENAQKWERL